MPETLCPSCGGPQETYEDPDDGSVEIYCPDCLCCVATTRKGE